MKTITLVLVLFFAAGCVGPSGTSEGGLDVEIAAGILDGIADRVGSYDRDRDGFLGDDEIAALSVDVMGELAAKILLAATGGDGGPDFKATKVEVAVVEGLLRDLARSIRDFDIAPRDGVLDSGEAQAVGLTFASRVAALAMTQ